MAHSGAWGSEKVGRDATAQPGYLVWARKMTGAARNYHRGLRDQRPTETTLRPGKRVTDMKSVSSVLSVTAL
jgi:hypothetical protein